MKSQQQNLRKAAVFVASLDDAMARQLLNEMSLDQAQLVRDTIDGLGPLDPFEQREVIEEFLRIGPMVPNQRPAGIELDDGLAARLSLPEETLVAESAPQHRSAADQPFRFLDEASPTRLAQFLEREHPQTAAVVLSHLSPEAAAEVLAGLPASLQAEVARRLVDLDETDPEILRDLEQEIEAYLAEQLRSDRRRVVGVAALANILDAAGRQTQAGILENIGRHDRQLAAHLAPRPTRRAAAPRPAVAPAPPAPAYTFADFMDLDDAAISAVLHRSDAEVVVLALAGAAPGLVERVMARLPLAEARTLRAALEHLGPTRLSDVEQAQQHLADLAAQLTHDGRLRPSPRKRLSVAV